MIAILALKMETCFVYFLVMVNLTFFGLSTWKDELLYFHILFIFYQFYHFYQFFQLPPTSSIDAKDVHGKIEHLIRKAMTGKMAAICIDVLYSIIMNSLVFICCLLIVVVTVEGSVSQFADCLLHMLLLAGVLTYKFV